MKAVVDQDLCVGDGVCVDICPEVFQMGDDDLAHVINDNPGPELEQRIIEARDACPVIAIVTEE